MPTTACAAHNHIAGRVLPHSPMARCGAMIPVPAKQHGFLALHNGMLSCNSINRRTNAYRTMATAILPTMADVFWPITVLAMKTDVGGYFARHHRQYRYHPCQCQPQWGAWLYCQSMPPCSVTAQEARDLIKGNGFVIGQSGFWWQFLMAYGNAGYGYHFPDNCQAFYALCPWLEKRPGRMYKVHSHVAIKINFHALPRFAYCSSSFCAFNLYLSIHH